MEDYFKELEMLMARADIQEDPEVTMSRFFGGLTCEIADKIELYHCVDLEEMVHLAIKAERQVKRRGYTRPNPSSSSSSWKPSATSTKESSRFSSKPKTEVKADSTKPKPQGNPETSTTRSRDLTCFKCQGKGHFASQCPNRRAMVLMDNGELVSESEPESEHEEVPEEESLSEDDALALVVRRTLNLNAKEGDDVQRENIFHARCVINDKKCSMIIDGGSCTNVASTSLVEQLDLPTTKHPQPYKLQWLNDCGEVKVSKQVLVSFRIGRYEDEVLCDVVPMQASHILPGRPWQFDRNARHNGRTNQYTLDHHKKRYTLAPLTPQQIREDQVKMLRKREQKERVLREGSVSACKNKEITEKKGRTKETKREREQKESTSKGRREDSERAEKKESKNKEKAKKNRGAGF